jgi:hypothetical protein
MTLGKNNKKNNNGEENYDLLRKLQFALRREAFVTGDFTGVRFMNGREGDNAKKSVKDILREEVIKQADVDIQSLAEKLMSKEYYYREVYMRLPRERQMLPDIEEMILKRYFHDDLTQWNKYLALLQKQYHRVHPLGVCFYIQELGFWDCVDEPQEHKPGYNISSQERRRIRKAVNMRKVQKRKNPRKNRKK